MSHRFRFATALLLLLFLTSGSLGALPIGSRLIPTEPGSRFLTALVEWVRWLFVPEGSPGDLANGSATKEGGQMDPNGGPH